MEIIGRATELQTIHHALISEEPQLVAVWGRRRVGKTFLLRNGREPIVDWYFELTGKRDGDTATQLLNFTEALYKAFPRGTTLIPPTTWDAAFSQLETALKALPDDGKPATVFFDEAPWLDSRRSGFLDALEYFWNAKGSKIPKLKMFVCGSAASWIVHKIVRGKGGWHRRTTDLMRVPQFNLRHISTYLEHRKIRLSRIGILRLYMALGGVPYYLSFMRRGESISSFVDRLFFSENPVLKSEFDELFDSLFTNAAAHKQIIRALAETKAGLTRSEIAERAKLPSGGKLTEYIRNLEESDFLEEHEPLGPPRGRYPHYRVSDMFTLFHLQWLAGSRKIQSWQAVTASQAYKSWCGHAFEILVWNHSRIIAEALGIAKTNYSVTRADLENEEGEAQIDLVFDVTGGSVYLFELKFCEGGYKMTAEEAVKIEQRRRVLNAHYKRRRTVLVCLLAPEGVQSNEHLKAAVDLVLDADALFRGNV
jgi:predicted AAA+ superfamily ATPase